MKSLQHLVFFVYFYSAFAKDLPSFIHVCHKSDLDKFEQCLRDSVEVLRPYLIKGEPEHKIPSLEPLVLNGLIREETGGLKVVTSNVKAYGCGDFIIKSMNMDLKTHFYKLEIDIPTLRIEADYTVDGKILVIPVKGDGNMEANVTDVKALYTMQGELFDKDGGTYLRFVSSHLSAKVGGGRIRLENLFNGDKVLLGTLNEAINKNLDAFIGELMPAIEKGLEKTILEISNDIVDGYTLDQLLPE